METTQHHTKAFIPLLLYCAALLTDVGIVKARKSEILYYAGGWYGGYPFSYGTGPGGSMWLSPSASTPLEPAHTDDSEGLSVSVPPEAQNFGGKVGNTGAGRLDVVSSPFVRTLSTPKRSSGTPRQVISSERGTAPRGAFAAGTVIPPLKYSGAKTTPLSSVKQRPHVNGSSQSLTVVATPKAIYENPLGSSVSSHIAKPLKSHAGSGETPVPSKIHSPMSKTTPSGSANSPHTTALEKLQHGPFAFGGASPTIEGSTSLGAKRHLEVSANSGLSATAAPPTTLGDSSEASVGSPSMFRLAGPRDGLRPMRYLNVVAKVSEVSGACAQGPDTTKTDAMYNTGGSVGREPLRHAAGLKRSGAAETPIPSEESGWEGTSNSGSLQPSLGVTPGAGDPIPADGKGSEAEYTVGNSYINSRGDSPKFPIGPAGPQLEQGSTRSIRHETFGSPIGYRMTGVGGVPARNPDVAEEATPERVLETVNGNKEPENAGAYSPVVGEGTPLDLTSDTAVLPDTLGSVIPLSNRNFESSDGYGNTEAGDNRGRRPDMSEVDELPMLSAAGPSEGTANADDYGSSISRVQPFQRRVVIVVPPGVRIQGARSDYTPDLSFSTEPQIEDFPASSSSYSMNRFHDSEDPYSVDESDDRSSNFRASGRHPDVFGGRGDVRRDYGDRGDLGQHKYAILLISPSGGGSESSNLLEEPQEREAILAL
ncbi:hypothetical protein HPB50_017810 [Hyalomma asiaticum]|uniref:Uncharacterized protein n=1 Tax=Hyalomma asiaticum TaxID=266040 RepID=A0ACB7S3V4_HYAAI|nr:hypothetical protein HPB50_017810 [Hyalomma asiaticum]